MRKNAYGIFKALRHFGVTAKEVNAVARAYTTWLSFPIEEKSAYNWVYYLNGQMISMPFEIKSLEDEYLIGYAVGTKVFSVAQGEKISKDNIESSLQILKQELDKRMLGAGEKTDLRLHLPTKEEAELVFNKFANAWFERCISSLQEIAEDLPEELEITLDFNAANQIRKMWITPSADEPEKTAVRFGMNNSGPYCRKYVPNPKAKATVCLFTDLRKGVDFIGKLDKYGTPTLETIKMYYELLANRY